jgi:hypothetical protein
MITKLLAKLALTLGVIALTLGCASQSGLSPTGQVALQEVTAIAVRRAVADSPRAAEKVANIRAVANQLLTITSITTVSQLRAQVDAEVAKLNLSPVDAADARSLLNIFEALLRERIGEDINADAMVQVNEFVAMIVAALPAV